MRRGDITSHVLFPMGYLLAKRIRIDSKMAYQASPKFIAPRHRGDTLTPAVGDRTRWYPRTLFGIAAGVKAILKIRYW